MDSVDIPNISSISANTYFHVKKPLPGKEFYELNIAEISKEGDGWQAEDEDYLEKIYIR